VGLRWSPSDPSAPSTATSAFAAGVCGKQFNERSGTLLNRTQCPSDVVALVVLWRLRFKLSLRDLPEMFAQRGMVFSYEAVRAWEAKLTLVLAEDLRRRRRGKVGRSWYVDETYIKVSGRWCYLYRAIDKAGRLVDVGLSEKRDMKAARAFFRSAKAVTDITPDRVTTDGHDCYPPGDPHRAGQGGAAPAQPLPEQQAGTGPPGFEGPIPVHARLQVPTLSRPVVGAMTSYATSCDPDLVTTSTFPPIKANCAFSAKPPQCWASWQQPDRIIVEE